MSSLSDDGSKRVLQAALTLFARHGFQRTSMADVASEAAISRATLYLRFRDKRVLFDALATGMVNEALAAAEAAWRPQATLADNLEATLLAKDLPLFRLLQASPHGAELLALDAELTRRHAERLDAEFATLLTHRAAEAAATRGTLAAFDGPAGFARFVALASTGLKHVARSEADYCDAVRRLCVIVARATEPGALT